MLIFACESIPAMGVSGALFATLMFFYFRKKVVLYDCHFEKYKDLLGRNEIN
jgi:hypothetical protein